MATYTGRPRDARVPLNSGLETIVVTDPMQLLVSSRTETTRGSLVFNLQATSGACYFHRLVIVVPTGERDQDLTATPQAINTLVGDSLGNKYTVTSDLADHAHARFTIAPVGGAVLFSASSTARRVLAVTLAMIELNTEPGRVLINYDLHTSSKAGGVVSAYNEVVDVHKTDNSFFFRDFHPEKAMIGNGGRVKLMWEASQHNTQLYLQQNDLKEQPVFGSSHTIDGVKNHAAFKLRAETTIAGETVNHYQTCTVLVDAPDITAKDLTVKGLTRLDQDLRVHGATVVQSLVAQNATTERMLTSNGGLTVVTGQDVDLGGRLIVNQGIHVFGKTELQDLTVTGDVALKKGVVMQGRVSIFGDPWTQSIKDSHALILSTDSFLRLADDAEEPASLVVIGPIPGRNIYVSPRETVPLVAGRYTVMLFGAQIVSVKIIPLGESAQAARSTRTVVEPGVLNSSPEWDPYGRYAKGAQVRHQSKVYEAVHDIQGSGDQNWINSLANWKPIPSGSSATGTT
ncbi:hypothetical protein V3C41_00500 [Paenarthrobacter nicotinovorans]|uniref:Chitin-binding type-3 domain-containing protein n=1 Tax=Paenarthrobacter nicotinovorans TaxID=29320 RepID=A0ABV0GLZ7_PAENI